MIFCKISSIGDEVLGFTLGTGYGKYSTLMKVLRWVIYFNTLNELVFLNRGLLYFIDKYEYILF